MSGMNSVTGRALSGLDHLYQSIAKILTTSIGSRIARRPFGSELPDLIDAPFNDATKVRLFAATATALMRQEPRLTLTRIQLSESNDLPTAPTLDIEGITTESGEAVSTSVRLTRGAE